MAMPMGEVQAVMSQVRGAEWWGKVGWAALVLVLVELGVGVIVRWGEAAWFGDYGVGGWGGGSEEGEKVGLWRRRFGEEDLWGRCQEGIGDCRAFARDRRGDFRSC